MTEEKKISAFERDNLAFESRLVQVTSAALVVAAFVMAAIAPYGHFSAETFVGAILIGLLALSTAILTLRGRLVVAKYALFIGGHGVTCVATLLAQTIEPITAITLIIFASFAAFVLSSRISLAMVAASILTLIFANVTTFAAGTLSVEVISLTFIGLLTVPIMGGAMVLFASRSRRHIELHRERLLQNEQLFERVPSAANRLSSAAQQITQMSLKHRQGAIEQSSAVQETRHSLRSLAEASQEIIISSGQTLDNARIALENAEAVSKQLMVLSEHTQRITMILDSIKELANKSDLLALNAALEGTRAGEAGKGFSLVANQMQRLAEDTAASVHDIHEMTSDIHRATAATQLAMGDATRLSRLTTEAAQRISAIIRQQKSSVEQVSIAMDDIATITSQSVHGADETIASSKELHSLADALSRMVEDFKAAASC